MTITREIDGKAVEIELTDDELHTAYEAKQFQFDRADMEDYLINYDDCSDDFKEQYGQEYANAMDNLDELARLMRRNITKWDVSWEYARGQAIEDWVSDLKQNNAKPLEYVGGGDYEETAE